MKLVGSDNDYFLDELKEEIITFIENQARQQTNEIWQPHDTRFDDFKIQLNSLPTWNALEKVDKDFCLDRMHPENAYEYNERCEKLEKKRRRSKRKKKN